ncbi:MAG: XRE family transcriptional regulator [Oscillospiraceae bacterium]|nr:XRE family transcriptional regulator [Oscillospiraceae bacterium]
MTKKDIGQRLKRLRRDCDMTQKEAADLIGRSQQNIAHWEGGVSQPGAETLFTLIRLYGVTSLDEFYDKNAEKPPEQPVVIHNAKQTTNSIIAFPSQEIKPAETPNAAAAKRANALMRVFLMLDDLGRTTVEQVAHAEQRRCEAALTERELLVYDTPASAGVGHYLDGDGARRLTLRNVPRETDFGIRIQGDSMEPRLHDGDIAFVKATPSLQNGDIGLFVLNNESFCKRLSIDYSAQKVYLESLNAKYLPIEVKSEDVLRTVGRIL